MKDTTLCEGDDLNFYPFPNTGTYKWSGPNGFTSNTANLSLHNVNPSMSGIYTVEGFTPCAFIDTFNITINPKPTTVIFPSDTIQVCSGTQVLLMVKPYIKGENYSWQDGSVQSTFLAKSTGKYTLVASNKYNCTKYSEVYISYYPKPPVKIIANSVSCVLDSVILTAQPASANYSYLWSTGENTKSIVVNKPAKYYLTVTDSLGCKNTDSITIKENLSVSITANGPLTLCKGDSVVLSASPIDSSYTYKWNTGETTTAITVNKPGIYTVIASLGDKCSDTASVTIENGYPTNLIINHNGPVTFCEGDSVILFAATSLPVISYEWSTGEISDSIIVNKSGTYKLVVQNSFGCRDSAEIDIQVIQEFDAEITGNLNFCEGQSTVLSAEPIGIAYNYLWSTGDTTQTITVNKSGLYTLVVSLNNSCIDSTTVNVTVYPLPIVQISGDSMLCPGRTSILLVQNDFPSYLWSTGETTKQINITQIGTYSVRVTDIYGCEDSTSIEVKQFDINLTGLVDIDFGTILSGASVQLKNESNTEIEIKDIYVKNQKNIFSITTNPALPLNLNIGSTTDIDVTFNRDMIKDYSDSVFIEIDKPCPSIIGAALKGSAKAITTIFLPNLTANVGQPNLCIPLTAKKDAGMTINDTLSYNAEIRFDASALYPYDTYPIIAGDWVIKLSGNNILFNNNEIELGNFCGVVLLANQDNTPLRITNFAWNNTNIEKTIIDGSLTVKGICQPDLARIRLFTPLQLQIIPNPSNELSVISYKLSEEGNVKLTLVSLLGQEVAVLKEGFEEAGAHSYQLSVNSYQLSEGVYFVKLAASGSIETEKMMIVK